MDSPIFLNSYKISLYGKIVGIGGEIDNIYYAEIDLDKILKDISAPQVTLWPKYPPQIEDITLVVPERTKIGEVIQSIKSVDNNVSEVELIDIYKDSHTFKIWYQDPKKTLDNEEVEKIRVKIVKILSNKGLKIKV